ncbi:hypothetical protein [Lysobacter xanthus]
MTEDLEKLAELPDGRLEIDVLRGEASHSSGVEPHLFIAGELQAWLVSRLSQLAIPAAAVVKAEVVADIRTHLLATNRKRIVSFDFAVISLVATEEREYHGSLTETHSWHSRVGAL